MAETKPLDTNAQSARKHTFSQLYCQFSTPQGHVPGKTDVAALKVSSPSPLHTSAVILSSQAPPGGSNRSMQSFTQLQPSLAGKMYQIEYISPAGFLPVLLKGLARKKIHQKEFSPHYSWHQNPHCPQEEPHCKAGIPCLWPMGEEDLRDLL